MDSALLKLKIYIQFSFNLSKYFSNYNFRCVYHIEFFCIFFVSFLFQRLRAGSCTTRWNFCCYSGCHTAQSALGKLHNLHNLGLKFENGFAIGHSWHIPTQQEQQQ